MKEAASPVRGDRRPVSRAEISIDAKLTALDRPFGEPGHDKGDVTGSRDNRMGAVGAALRGAGGVRMHVGYDLQAIRCAEIPELPEMAAIKADDPGVERVRIDVIIEHEGVDATAPVAFGAEQEGAAFAREAPALPKADQQPEPKVPRAGKLMLRRDEAPHSRRN